MLEKCSKLETKGHLSLDCMELFSYGCPNHGMNDLMQKLIPTEEKMVNPNTDSDEHNLFFFF